MSRPHDGHAIITGPRSRRPSALRISQATSTSLTGSAVKRDADRVADPVHQQRAHADCALDPARERRSRLRHAEVQRVRDLVGEHPVGPDHRRDVRRLDRDLEVAEVEPLEDLDLLERLDDERLGRVCARELLEVLGERAGVGADPHRDPGPLRRPDDLLGLVGAADVARVDADRVHARLDRLQRERRVEVDVRDHRDRREPDDQRERLRVLELRHGDPDDLAAGRGERGDLRGRRLDVVRLRERHRLHDDGRATADRDAADLDLMRARHPPFRVAAPSAWLGQDACRAVDRPARHVVAPRAAARRPRRTTSGRSAPTSSPGRCSRPTGSASSRCRSGRASAGSRRRGARIVPVGAFSPRGR